ncbi:hypothetical protein HDV01_007649 [Terramyces sp. JEL0728]|nr:hypothetical protein HDV01_007649 [Terramyces sp. JEL0728]
MKLFFLVALLSATYTGEQDPEIFAIFKGLMDLEGADDHFEPMRLSNNYEDEPQEPQAQTPGSYLKGQYFAAKFIHANDLHYADYQPDFRKRDLTNSATSISVSFDSCSLNPGSTYYFFLDKSGTSYSTAGGCNGIFDDNAANANVVTQSHPDVTMDTLGICSPHSTFQEGLEFMFQSSAVKISPVWLLMALCLV